LAERTGKFTPSEIGVLGELLADYFESLAGQGHRCEVAEDGGLVGFAYYAPASMSASAWHLYWLAVDPSRQGRGAGRATLNWVEERVRAAGGTQILIETSSSPHYAQTRAFIAPAATASRRR
jgi:GNAT superfamily N-acetyltransferase